MGKIDFNPSTLLNPVPVVMISSENAEKNNIFTAAWVGTVCSEPPIVSVSIRKERLSYSMIKETGEFVINLVTKELAKACDYCGVKSGRDVDKFKELKLTPLESQNISAPGIEESPVRLECRVEKVLELGSHDMFIAKIVGITADDKYLSKNGKYDLEKAGLICYSHGEYFSLGEKLGFFGYSIAAPDVLKRRMQKEVDLSMM